jgi:hypothetical protein
MNFRLRQERNAFVFLVVVATPLVLLSAPLPYLSSLATVNKPLARASLQPVNVEQAFARADRNRDGYIDASEAGAIPGLVPLFALIDRNGDGKIDRQELATMRLPRERPGETRT